MFCLSLLQDPVARHHLKTHFCLPPHPLLKPPLLLLHAAALIFHHSPLKGRTTHHSPLCCLSSRKTSHFPISHSATTQNMDPVVMSRQGSVSKPAAPAVAAADSHSVTKRLQSELVQLMFSKTPGISAFPESDSNLLKWSGIIEGPKDTPYQDLKFKISLEFPPTYPYTAPTVKFVSPMWHPNVDMSGNICLDILKEKWSAIYNVQTILLSLQSLLGEPNNKSPLNAQAAQLWDTDPKEYKRLLLQRYEEIDD